MRDINPQILQEHAQRIELKAATNRLLKCFFSENGNIYDIHGRHQFIEKAIKERPKFLKALLNENDKSVQQKWQKVLADNKTDTNFNHGIALMYQDQALQSLNKGTSDERLWLLSTTLWLHLLCSENFWDYFSEARFAERENAERRSLSLKQQETLFHEAWQSILLLHKKYCLQNYAAGRYEQARTHLRCIDLCRKDGSTLRAILKGYGIPFDVKQDNDKLQQIRNIAEKLLDDWGSTLVKDAEKVMDNAEAIKKLPKGIRKNYEGGIQYLENILKLDVLIIRVLCTSLHWYNDWCYDLYVTKDIERIKEQMQYARIIADKLALNCMQGCGFKLKNQGLSQHFLLRGFTADEPDHAVKEYEEALKWNPGNENAKNLLGEAAQQVFVKQVNTAIECMIQEKFDEAYDILNSVEKQIDDKNQIIEVRAVVCFHHAQKLANDGKFRDALIRAREALKLKPSQDVFKGLTKELEELAPEENNLRYFHNAQVEYEKEHYDNTIDELSRVAKTSKFYNKACTLKSAAYFHRGITAANKLKFDQAMDDMEHALGLNKKEDERKIIASQLEIIQQNKIGYELKQALETQNWAEAEKVLHNAISGNISSKVKQELESQLEIVQQNKVGYELKQVLETQNWTKAEKIIRHALSGKISSKVRKELESQMEIIQHNKIGHELKQAIETNNWLEAEQILREAIKGSVSSKVKRELESQLSIVLNKHAVSRANEMQEDMKTFGDAMQFIFASVKSIQESGLSRDILEKSLNGRNGCAVCGEQDAKMRVILRIIQILHSKGGFSVNGIETFWSPFREDLCISCKNQLDSFNKKKREPIELLNQAIKFDRNNQSAKQNLEALKKI